MIGTQTPFRVSFIGGGTDIKEFYQDQPGCVVSTSINKYMYLFVHPRFDNKIQVKYSKTELVDHVDEIRHPIVREALRMFRLSGIDVNSIADIPAGSGLGSSCSFSVGLLHALYAYTNQYPSKEKLARQACEIEIDVLKEPIGKQDQYAASYGGLNCITFFPDGSVRVEPLNMKPAKQREFEANLLLFYTGETRAASDVLADQVQNMAKVEKKQGMARMAALALDFKEALQTGRLSDLGAILHENWQIKRTLSSKVSDPRIDHYYQIGMEHGAQGGKLLGAGGGGFLLFYCEQQHQDKLRSALSDLRCVKIKFDMSGTRVIYVGEQVEEESHV